MDQATAPTVNDAPAPPANPCPRCEKPLVDARGLGWCQACGYCRSLDEDRARLPLAPVAPNAAAQGRSASARPQVPVWALGLIAGVVVLAVGSWVAGHSIPLRPLHRAIWATIQLSSGIIIMFLAQCFALLRVAPEEAALHFVDAVVPFRLYGLVFKRLPRLGLVLCVASWGLTIALSAILCIGGMGHWLNYLPKSRQSQQMQWK
jgi:hypothetical protein